MINFDYVTGISVEKAQEIARAAIGEGAQATGLLRIVVGQTHLDSLLGNLGGGPTMVISSGYFEQLWKSELGEVWVRVPMVMEK